MELNIGSVIQKLRKIKGLTQEQVADAIGVSKAAVSKWEIGSTYPDIVLLAPLARLLDTNINELFEFHAHLTEKEVTIITTLCEQEFLKGDYFSAYDYCEKQLKKYPNAAKLKLVIASLYWQYTTLLKDNEETRNAMVKRACEVLEEASEISDSDIKEHSLYVLSSLYITIEDYDNALKTAEKMNQKSNDTMLLLATIYRHKGENDNAKDLYQRLLFQSIRTGGLVLHGLSKVAEKESGFEDAQFFLETIIKLDTLFEVQNVGGSCTLQLAELYARSNHMDKAIDMLKQYVKFMNTLADGGREALNNSRFFSDISGDESFNDVQEEKSEFIKQRLAEEIIDTPAFAALKEDGEFQKIIKALKS